MQEESWNDILGTGEGRTAWRSAPLSIGKPPYWHAAARIRLTDERIAEAALALQGPRGMPRRLGVIEAGLVAGELTDADNVLDAVRDLVECVDDADGSAAAKSYLAGWICADVVGRCLLNPEAG
ncbi:MAG: hypothetical protein KAJ98_08590 [Spirochaetaceae bacterium]|nr:hypothetical protein [Spirochaetaceae bacterium]